MRIKKEMLYVILVMVTFWNSKAAALPVLEHDFREDNCVACLANAVQSEGINAVRKAHYAGLALERFRMETDSLSGNLSGRNLIITQWGRSAYNAVHDKIRYQYLSEIYWRKWSRNRFVEILEERCFMAAMLRGYVSDLQVHLDNREQSGGST